MQYILFITFYQVIIGNCNGACFLLFVAESNLSNWFLGIVHVNKPLWKGLYPCTMLSFSVVWLVLIKSINWFESWKQFKKLNCRLVILLKKLEIEFLVTTQKLLILILTRKVWKKCMHNCSCKIFFLSTLLWNNPTWYLFFYRKLFYYFGWFK